MIVVVLHGDRAGVGRGKYVEHVLGIAGDGCVEFSNRMCPALDELSSNMCLGP